MKTTIIAKKKKKAWVKEESLKDLEVNGTERHEIKPKQDETQPLGTKFMKYDARLAEKG